MSQRDLLPDQGERVSHRCVECGSEDRGQRDWGLDHAQRCGGFVPRPPGWHSAASDDEGPKA